MSNGSLASILYGKRKIIPSHSQLVFLPMF